MNEKSAAQPSFSGLILPSRISRSRKEGFPLINVDEQHGVDLNVEPDGRETDLASEKKHFEDKDGKQESPASFIEPGHVPKFGDCKGGQSHSPEGEPYAASTAVMRPRGHDTDTVFNKAE